MQSAQHSARRERFIILYELHIAHVSGKFLQFECLREISAGIAETLRLYYPHTLYFLLYKLHDIVEFFGKISNSPAYKQQKRRIN